MTNLLPVSSKPLITPCSRAPLYSGDDTSSRELLRQATNVITSETGFSTSNLEIRELLRQTGMVNLFFYLRFICGHAGPYTELTPELHMDICNFYQRTRKPGTRAFGCLPRGWYKSTVWTYGGTSWDIVRDPDWEEVLCSSVVDRAIEFNGYIQEIFSKNDLIAWLYTEYVLEEGRNLATNAKMTRVPCKRTNKPNVRIAGVGASIQGLHAKSFKVDDLIGEHMLDSARQLGADNEKAANWMKAAIRNIPTSKKNSIIFADGTRYGPEDAWTFIWNDMCEFFGYTQGEPYEIKPDGEWMVYYRASLEDHGDGDQPMFPEKETKEELYKILREDPWTFYTQKQNMSTYSGLSEMIEYSLKDCTLDVNENGEYAVSYFDPETSTYVEERLEEMNVFAALDPAASEKRRSVRTSKSAYVIMARNWKDYRFWLHVNSGFVAITKVLDWLFEGYAKFRKHVLSTNVEVQGPFKMLRSIITEEQMRRNEYINLRPVTARGDKDGRIRMYLQPLFERGLMFATKSCEPVIRGEMSVFPDGHQKDVLDAMAIAEAASYRPNTPEDEDDAEESKVLMRGTKNPVTGY